MLNLKTAVVGAGRIGAGMATLMAGHGCNVVQIGLNEDDLNRCRGFLQANMDELVNAGLATDANRKAVLARIHLTTDYSELAGCVFVHEAAFENKDVKCAIYAQVEEIVAADTIIASTTSAISADLLAADMKHPERFIVAHPFQPSHMNPLVELVGNPKTTPEVMARAKTLLESLDRQVVTLNKSVPGFIVNRFAQALFRESIYLMEEGVVSSEDIDKAIKYAVGMRYAEIGLLEYFDDVGFELERDIALSIYPDLCNAQEIQKTVLDGIAAGKVGRANGEGLRDWSTIDDADYLDRKAKPYFKIFNWDMPSE